MRTRLTTARKWRTILTKTQRSNSPDQEGATGDSTLEEPMVDGETLIGATSEDTTLATTEGSGIVDCRVLDFRFLGIGWEAVRHPVAIRYRTCQLVA